MNGHIAQKDVRRRIAVIHGSLAGLMAPLRGDAALSFYYEQRDVVGAGLQGRETVMWTAYAALEVQ
jgi:hypothetical protein